jgi:hypothetical protein
MILVDRYIVFRIQYPNALPRIDPSDCFNKPFKNEFVKKLEGKQGRPEDAKCNQPFRIQYGYCERRVMTDKKPGARTMLHTGI